MTRGSCFYIVLIILNPLWTTTAAAAAAAAATAFRATAPHPESTAPSFRRL